MVLIGIIGNKESGKTTSGKYIVDKYKFIERTFAHCLKKACQELFLLSDDQVYGSQEQKEAPDSRWFDCSPRKILQYVGTDLMRDQFDVIMPGLGKNIFIHHFKIWYQEYINLNPEANIIITDVRFLNEISFITSLGGIIIKIERPNINESDTHQSETELRQYKSSNFTIDNSKNIIDLYANIDCIMNCIIASGDKSIYKILPEHLPKVVSDLPTVVSDLPTVVSDLPTVVSDLPKVSL